MVHTLGALKTLQWLPMSLRIKSEIITIAFLHDFSMDCLSVLIPSGLLRAFTNLLSIPKTYQGHLCLWLLLLLSLYCEMPVSPLCICRVQAFASSRSLKCYLSGETFYPLYPVSYFITFLIYLTVCDILICLIIIPPTPASYHHTQMLGCKVYESRILSISELLPREIKIH